MIPDFTGDFLSYDSTKDGDIVEIVDEGKMEFSETLNKDMFNLRVKHNNKVKIYSPNNKAGTALQTAFGLDSSGWIGKKFQILHIDKKMHIRPLTENKI